MVGLPLRACALLCVCIAMLTAAGVAMADAPLTQGFEDSAPAWTATGMWNVKANDPALIVIPDIFDRLVTLADDGRLPDAVQGDKAAWFGEAATGTYCGSDYRTIKQTPQNGCTSTSPQTGLLASPSFSLAGQSSAFVVFRAWWEIEAVYADTHDLMQVVYSVDGGPWQLAGLLNQVDPAWGGGHQPYGSSDEGVRSKPDWAAYRADISAAAGEEDVRIGFLFDSVDAHRNGFRGLLVDGVAVTDAAGQTLDEPSAGPFTDAPPSVTVRDVTLGQDPAGNWKVDFDVDVSHPSHGPVDVDWHVQPMGPDPVVPGTTVVPPGSTGVPVSVPVPGTGAPYTVVIDAVAGGTVDPSGSTASTPGGAVPLLGLETVGAAPAPEQQMTITIPVTLSAPAAGPVTVDYTVTGSDGVVGGTGTIALPSPTTTASTSIAVGVEHAPYTVALSNPRGALLAKASTAVAGLAVGTEPVATVTSSDPGSQLVLGVRQTGGQRPDYGSTFMLTRLSGTITYRVAGEGYRTLPDGSLLLPFGTVVDATSGHALITVESDAGGTLQQGEFWAGKFGVFQQRARLAVAELRLAGGNYRQCVKAARLRKKTRRGARSAGSTVVRKLWGKAKGRFRTKGRFASATVRGTEWGTEDLCLATRVTVREGVVAVFDNRRKTTTFVRAGEQKTVTALRSARFRKRLGIHSPRLSRA